MIDTCISLIVSGTSPFFLSYQINISVRNTVTNLSERVSGYLRSCKVRKVIRDSLGSRKKMTIDQKEFMKSVLVL